MSVNTFDITATLPTQVLFRNIGGEPVYLDLTKIAPNVWKEIALGGIQIIMNNTFNSGGKGMSDTDRLAKAMKRYDSWVKGQYCITERAVSQASLMQECYIGEMVAKHDTTEKVVKGKMKATVTEAFGKDTSATFDNFLKATAQLMADRKGEARTADEIEALLVAKYEKAAAELEASRAKANDVEIDLTDIDI